MYNATKVVRNQASITINFYWINIWESEVYREQFLAKWIKSNNSGIFARALSSSAVCKNPSIYLFL